MKALLAKADQLEQQYQLEFPTFMQDFKRNNSTAINRIINK
jgi:spermidine synthase